MRVPQNVKVKTGQLWRKKDTGTVIQLTGKLKKDYYSFKRVDGVTKKGHSVYSKDLKLFYERVYNLHGD